MSNKEKISEGICISERGVEHCGYCTDMCEASHFKFAIKEMLEDAKVSPPKSQSDKKQDSHDQGA